MARYEATYGDGSFQVSGSLHRMLSQATPLYEYLTGRKAPAVVVPAEMDPRDVVASRRSHGLFAHSVRMPSRHGETEGRYPWTLPREVEEELERSASGLLEIADDNGEYDEDNDECGSGYDAADGADETRQAGADADASADKAESEFANTRKPAWAARSQFRPASQITFTNRGPYGNTYDISMYM
ncbi:uncharacterized protein AMSG_10251 [Thecamonas trahens ATCC 50062]|uniref:Uncharacterized protein n=1 Tax=Thecamonas trahens ATCC 50062 TaxID=461836 RepID=A0A0L0DRY1_THETB|nr:hypothetical protein AMSG_10251 [Thecamonas trahens ATCC 50062]KNC55002.1 hypothetical protein AMSG_10251 [Thecamonas trahens ATCC 50062]|eukprot:XP_013753445.1 hypothetical protein AMSG_10251 [Thecamonas trahens ATCC 50062]